MSLFVEDFRREIIGSTTYCSEKTEDSKVSLGTIAFIKLISLGGDSMENKASKFYAVF